ncbi:glycosyltransferase [Amycolatopsis sp. NBC_00438]|uniref:glycosyltransferase n=1 Tax=Amycolatopsis sp. NBC_00438 TaxID=2903558 RepID=UPI002E245F68
MAVSARVLLTCLPYYSHLVPVLVPVAKALRKAGHAVAVASAPAMADELARHGVEHVPLPHVRTLEQLLADPAVLASPGMPGAEDEEAADTARAREEPGALTKAFAGPLAGIFARDLIAAAERWRPDVLVRECNEFGGYLAAVKLGLPRAVLDIAPFTAAHLPFLHDTLNAELAALGAAPADDPLRPNDGLLAGVVPAAWYPERRPSLRCYRTDDPGAPDDGFAPLAVAGLGTVAHTVVPEASRLLAAMALALGELPGPAVLSTGPGEWTGPRPSNVRIVPFAPQARLLGRASLFLSHGGFGGVQEALRAATPMVVLPLFADQPANARRIAELGLGLAVDPAEATPETLAAACSRVLAPGFGERAAEFARPAGDLPGFDVLAEDLAALS